jgi:hypothetical protein
LASEKPVFENMINGAFQEAVSQPAVLPEDDSRDFEKFVSFLYRGMVMSVVLNAPGGQDQVVVTKLKACFIVEWTSIATN